MRDGRRRGPGSSTSTSMPVAQRSSAAPSRHCPTSSTRSTRAVGAGAGPTSSPARSAPSAPSWHHHLALPLFVEIGRIPARDRFTSAPRSVRSDGRRPHRRPSAASAGPGPPLHAVVPSLTGPGRSGDVRAPQHWPAPPLRRGTAESRRSSSSTAVPVTLRVRGSRLFRPRPTPKTPAAPSGPRTGARRVRRTPRSTCVRLGAGRGGLLDRDRVQRPGARPSRPSPPEATTWMIEPGRHDAATAAQ